MTADLSQIQAQLRGMRERLDYSKRDGLTIEEVARIGLDLVGLVEAIVEMPRKPTDSASGDIDVELLRAGYNAHRAEVLAKAAEGLGVVNETKD